MRFGVLPSGVLHPSKLGSMLASGTSARQMRLCLSPTGPVAAGRLACNNRATCPPSAGWHWALMAGSCQETAAALSAASRRRASEEVRVTRGCAGRTLGPCVQHSVARYLPSQHVSPATIADPVWSPCTSPNALQGSSLRLGQHTIRVRLAGSTAESSWAASTVQLISSGTCPPPSSSTPATWDCAGPTSPTARNAECGALGQDCCKMQQTDLSGVGESTALVLCHPCLLHQPCRVTLSPAGDSCPPPACLVALLPAMWR